MLLTFLKLLISFIKFKVYNKKQKKGGGSILYISDSLLLPNHGEEYRFQKIDVEEAKQLLMKNPWISAINDESTLKTLSTLLETEIDPNKMQISLKLGDQVLVFKPDTFNKLKTGYELILIERIK